MKTNENRCFFKEKEVTTEASFLHLTNHDLDYGSRHKKIEEITLNDFSYNYPYADQASYVFYVDIRPKSGWLHKILGNDNKNRKNIKQLKP